MHIGTTSKLFELTFVSTCYCFNILYPFSTDCCWHWKGPVFSQSCLPSPCITSYLVNTYYSAFQFHCSHGLWDQELILLHIFGHLQSAVCLLGTVSNTGCGCTRAINSIIDAFLFNIKILIRSPSETKDSVCLVDLLFHILGEFQHTVHEDAKVFLHFWSA